MVLSAKVVQVLTMFYYLIAKPMLATSCMTALLLLELLLPEQAQAWTLVYSQLVLTLL